MIVIIKKCEKDRIKDGYKSNPELYNLEKRCTAIQRDLKILKKQTEVMGEIKIAKHANKIIKGVQDPVKNGVLKEIEDTKNDIEFTNKMNQKVNEFNAVIKQLSDVHKDINKLAISSAGIHKSQSDKILCDINNLQDQANFLKSVYTDADYIPSN